MNSGSETVGVEEDMGQKLWREDCRCDGDEEVGMFWNGGVGSRQGGDRAAEKRR